MTCVFITRILQADSEFRRILEARDFRVTGHSLVRFEAVAFDRLPETDWIFFYSQKAVAFFFRRVVDLGIAPGAQMKWGAIGPATAAAMETWGVRADFTGTGDPEVTARLFLALARGRRVLFPRAAQSRQSVQQMLAGEIEALDLIVYENAIDPEAPRPEADVLVFTSPLNAKAYFARRRFHPETKVIAIGQTTEAALREIGVKEVITAEEPSERGLAEKVLML